MRYYKWVIKKQRIKAKPTWYVWGLWFYRKVPVYLDQMPVKIWMQLKDVKFDIDFAPYILGVYLNLPPEKIYTMKAKRVIALYRHIRAEVNRCNQLYENAMSILLDIPDGVDKSHFEGIADLLMIYDLADKDILKAEKVENIKYALVLNWTRVKNAIIRYEQNRYLKTKQEHDNKQAKGSR